MKHPRAYGNDFSVLDPTIWSSNAIIPFIPNSRPSPRPRPKIKHPWAKTRIRRAYANDFSILNPTIWANEAIIQLLPNMVVSNLINRDFDNDVAKFGDVVNAFIPGTFQMTRKGALCENVSVQDASGASLQVALDQWPQVSFLICDGEEDRAALDLVDTLLVPAVIAMAQGIDRVVGSQVYHFLENAAGHANNGDETNIRAYMLETREMLNRNNVPLANRTMILSPGTETEALSVEQFTDANKVGDNGTALREAALGRKYGFDIFMSQTQPEVSTGQTTVGVITVTSSTAATSKTVTVTGSGAVAGQWAVFAGDDTPQHIESVVGAVLTISPGLKRAVPASAAVTILASGTTGAAYYGTSMKPRIIGYAKEILVNGLANSPPQVGQLISFGTDEERYAIIGLSLINIAGGNFGITLDRPLANPVGAGMAVNLGPAAKYNFAFLRNAFTLVNRPLAAPRPGTGALSRTVVDDINKISIRVTITYDGNKQGHLVTLDTLIGVGVLSHQLGAVMLA